MTPKVLTRQIVSAATQAFWSPDDLLGEIQATLAALADVEYRYERDRERLMQQLGPDAVFQPLWAERERRYEAEREPYRRRVEQLQRRMRRNLFSGL
ncbi:hypothetical protein [Microvirga tunisiensis]|jgi:hypothetical protein|uniref:Uncharacterized protein n=1 Tax=Microvirga tunisiensis TaxID=2108360 RepID=A0A5N7MSA7_9HYPH|nr:hypothetical protein [Microvirga tunisiensis]MPR11540.1 hypothetical protein [Microvirga tunisiensis]MPR29540.1 hypothetical protein [Microvirga tunisiensis]